RDHLAHEVEALGENGRAVEEERWRRARRGDGRGAREVFVCTERLDERLEAACWTEQPLVPALFRGGRDARVHRRAVRKRVGERERAVGWRDRSADGDESRARLERDGAIAADVAARLDAQESLRAALAGDDLGAAQRDGLTEAHVADVALVGDGA